MTYKTSRKSQNTLSHYLKNLQIDIWYEYWFPSLDNISLNINYFIIHIKFNNA